MATADEETDEGADDEVEEGPHRPLAPGLSDRESGFSTPTGGTTFIGLFEVWIYEDLDEGAETSRVWLNFGQPAVTDLGIVLWANRSPNLYPANSGVPITKAATVRAPAGESTQEVPLGRYVVFDSGCTHPGQELLLE